MPRKRYRKTSQTQKQLKIIQARLLEISLKMDKYIYKNRPISVNDAQVYYQQVTSFRRQCGGNARILQVIDKLKHQLKAILEDQGSFNYHNVQEIIENSMSTCPLSPTYSMHNEAIDVSANGIIIVEKDNNATLDSQATAIDSIDLCSDENADDIILIETKIQNDVFSSNIKDVERTLSNLAVNTENTKQTQNVAKDAVPDDMIPRFIVTNGSDKNTAVMDIDTQKQRCAVSVSYKVKHGKNIIKVGDVKTTDNNAINNNNANSIDFSKLDDKISEKIAPKKKRRTIKTKENDLNKNVNEIPKKRGRIKKTCKAQKATVNTDKINNDCIENVPPKCAVNKTKPVQVLSKTHRTNTLYNNNVKNDLSWIENIRYIREVAPDETDPTLTYSDDSFWQTLELSANWNDLDFSY